MTSGTILKDLQKGVPDAYIKLRWFYKPSDMFSVQQNFISQFELFDSDQEQIFGFSASTKRVGSLALMSTMH